MGCSASLKVHRNKKLRIEGGAGPNCDDRHEGAVRAGQLYVHLNKTPALCFAP